MRRFKEMVAFRVTEQETGPINEKFRGTNTYMRGEITTTDRGTNRAVNIRESHTQALVVDEEFQRVLGEVQFNLDDITLRAART
jgi:hypothetical protein